MSGDGYDCFISYASPDLALAEALRARLVEAKFKVWFDKARLEAGCDWHKHIEAGCEASRIVLPILTPRWKLSEWTRYETYGHASVIPLIAEGEEPAVLPPPLRRWQAQRFNPLATDEAVWEALFAAIRGKLAEPVPERAPRILDLPHPANPFFTGRDADLVRIHEELHEAPVAALTQGRVRALAAMGGVGKTTLANEYARRFWRLYPQILWVDARVGLESGFALLFGKLFPDRADEDLKQEDKARLALAELSGKQDRLLVIDNVEDAESVRPWLPRDATTGCRTLITSRFSDFPAAAGIRSIPLYVLEPEPSRQFLLARTGRTADGAELVACDALAKTLGYLPLALEQAAAYIAAPGAGVGFAAYLRLHEAAAADLLARKALGSTDYPDAVITTWQTTVAKLSPESRAVLRLCAWYADTPIPRALVMQGAEEVFVLAAQFGPVIPPANPVAAELRMRDALVGLARYSMILDATDTTFRVHGLVQAVERVRAADSGQDVAAATSAAERLATILPNDYFDPSHWDLCRQLVPHVNKIGTASNGKLAAAAVGRALFRAGQFMIEQGRFREARTMLSEALRIRERELGAEHADTLTAMNSLAISIRRLGDAAGALTLHQRALEGQERVLGVDHQDTLTSINNVAACMSELGDEANALPLYRRALEGMQRVVGPEHPETLRVLNNLAICMRALGDAAGALPVIHRALEISERALGAEHPDTLRILMNLAQCKRELGDDASALAIYRRVLECRERVLGTEHPDTFNSVAGVAACLDRLGCSAEAESFNRRLLEAQMHKLGAEHPDVLTACNQLAHLLRKAKRPDLALAYARRAADGSERVLAHNPSLVLNRRGNLALTLVMTSENSEARRLLAGTWAWPAPDCSNTTPRIAFLGLLADLLDGGNGADAIGRLKPLLLGPKLPMAAGVAYPWDVGYLLDYLVPRLPDGDHDFLTALLAAINNPDLAPALDRFPIWRDTAPIARNAPWPELAAEPPG